MRGPSYSGASLWFGQNTVIKRVVGGRAAERLRAQGALLLEWTAPPSAADVRVPRASMKTDGDEVVLSMERIPGSGLALGCPEWPLHLERLVGFLRAELAVSTDQDVTAAILAKLDDLERTIREIHGEVPVVQQTILALRRRLRRERVVLPVGPHHGDLTLCNVLCDCATNGPGAIALVDLSATYLASPVADIAKVRQDSASRWVRLFNRDVDPCRLDEADGALTRTFEDAVWYRWLPLLETIQLLRVLPYASQKPVISWVLAELRNTHNRRESWPVRLF